MKPTFPKTNVCGSVPNEIWMKIIGYLKCEDIFLGFGRVCKRFNDLTHDPTAIKSFELLKDYSILSTPGTHEVLKILQRSKSLKRIVINSRNAPHDLLIEEALLSNPQLKSVTLTSTWIKKNSCSKIVEYLTKAKRIEHLEIQNHYHGYEPFDDKLLMKIASIKNLKSLKINLRKVIQADFIKKISMNCINLETLELNNFTLDNPDGVQIAFNKLFKERKETLKSFILLHSTHMYNNQNMNILRYLRLCQNLEELSVESNDYVLKQLPAIAKMRNIKRLMFTNDDNFERFESLIKAFNEAKLPLLERLCIEGVEQSGEIIGQNKLFSDASLKSLLKKSPCLKSIHLLGISFEHDIWNISNKLLFQIIRDSNVYINFGKVKIGYDYKVGAVLSAKDKNQKRQLSLEQYLLDHDMSVFNKYQKMKDDFSIWFKERSNWHSFDCMNELHKEN